MRKFWGKFIIFERNRMKLSKAGRDVCGENLNGNVDPTYTSDFSIEEIIEEPKLQEKK